jgi:hypothetical chaperone protein
MPACGLDFGTSNSALGIVRDGVPMLAPVEGDATLSPSAIFFDFEHYGRVLYGRAAVDAYIGQHDGRLMRALKTVLGSSLMDEKTAVGRKRIALTEVVELFIRHLKSRAEEFAGWEIDQVVHGRPVRFTEHDDEAERRAQSVLEDIAHRAGFRDVVFVYEPIAAAFHYEETAPREELVLVADIGGGTSDFSVIRVGPERRAKIDRRDDILANAGIRIGGTDFDRFLNIDAVMPLLGLGTQLITKDLPMPGALYYELATWATINFAYTQKNERDVAELVADSRAPEKTVRLLHTLRKRLGHRIAFAAEDAKIALSEDARATIPLGFLERNLLAETSQTAFDRAIADKTKKLREVAAQCIVEAGVRTDQIHTIFVTGGSSRVPAVRQALSKAAPSAQMTSGSDLLSVAYGLTREAERRFGG